MISFRANTPASPRPSQAGRPAILIAALVATLTAAAGCAPPEPPEIIHLLELASHPAAGRYESSASRNAPTILKDEDLKWTPVPNPERQTSEKERALFFEHAAKTESGGLTLGAVPGAWATVVELEPNTIFKISAQAELEGLLPGPGYRTARLLAVDFQESPKSLSLEDLLAVELSHAWSTPLDGDGITREAELVFRTNAESHSVGLFLFLAMNKPFEGTRVTWKNVRLSPALPLDHLRAANEEPLDPESEQVLPVGAFIIGETYRPALALFKGDRAELDVTLPTGRSRLDAWIGVPPYALIREGASASVDVFVRKRGSDSQSGEVSLGSFEVKNQIEEPTRWVPLRVDLPKKFAGAPVTLRFEATSKTDGPVVIALGGPRIVPRKPKRVGPNVVLISLDTLRADRLGSYGGPAINSPSIDALAAESLLFENAWSPATYTLPSHVSIFSGQLPSVHGVQRPANRIDRARTTLLANYLAERGYTTGSFTGGGYLHPNFGFASGFESYGTIDPVTNPESLEIREGAATNSLLSMDLIEDNNIERVVEWLESHANESFLLFFHSYIAHQFDPSPEAARALGVKPRVPEDFETLQLLFSHENPPEEHRKRLFELYDATVRQADTAVGRLIETLRELELLEDTIVVLTSDHGKEIGDHGKINHGHTLHHELVNVPLILRVPGYAAERRAAPVSGVDIFPTILELLDLPLPHATPVQGSSLLSPAPDRPVFAEVDGMYSGVALREGKLKTIVMSTERDWSKGGIEQSFDVEADPLELAPLELSEERRERALEFGRALRALGASLRSSDGTRRALDPETKARLESLGYTIGLDD